ncbi:MAG: LytTR family DNA-binding domain-containing protein [Saprospiraceae bacterium]
MKLLSIIVDDEPIARKGLEEDIRDIDFIDVIGIAENTAQAMELVISKKPDLIFLDIEMPRINGLDFIKSLKDPPIVIIITAYSKYALKGYELDVLDFLVKPIDFDRLQKACNKAWDFYTLKHQASNKEPKTNSFFFVKVNGKFERINFNELLFVEAANNYVIYHTSNKKFLVNDTLRNVVNTLPAFHFIKIHKSYVVSVSKIESLTANEVTIAGRPLPISRSFKEVVLNNRMIGRSPKGKESR